KVGECIDLPGQRKSFRWNDTRAVHSHVEIYINPQSEIGGNSGIVEGCCSCFVIYETRKYRLGKTSDERAKAFDAGPQRWVGEEQVGNAEACCHLRLGYRCAFEACYARVEHHFYNFRILVRLDMGSKTIEIGRAHV